MKIRRVVCGLFCAAFTCALVAAMAIAGGGQRVATGVDTYRVTGKHLRKSLRKSSINIHFIQQENEPLPTVSGIGTSGEAELGFEFQIYPSSREATIAALGTLRPRDFGWSVIGSRERWLRRIRGVLANVAYAQYEVEVERPRETARAYLRREAAHRRVLRALDDALFASFPVDDPYAYALVPAR